MRALCQLGLHQIEQIPDALDQRQLFGREPNVKLAFDPHHQPDQVDRVQAQSLSKVFVVLRQRKRLAHLFFEQRQELRA